MAPTVFNFLAHGYLPKELPPIFTSVPFAQFVAANSSVVGLPLGSAKGNDLVTQCASHTLARPGGVRRRLKVPNPFGYLALCRSIVTNWPDISTHLRSSRFSLSTPVEDSQLFRCVKPKAEVDEQVRARARTRRDALHAVQADIATFYSSVYTHAVPWALHGKAVAKKNRHDKSLLGNLLDANLRNLQDQQTLGIPTGPDASLVLAEIVATAVDARVANRAFEGHRFIDDYELAAKTLSVADSALVALEQALAEFELALNNRKTRVLSLPTQLERPWLSKLRHFPMDKTLSRSETIRFFDLAFELKAQFPFDGVLSFAIARLNLSTPVDWELTQDLLMQSALVEPGVLEQVCRVLHSHRSLGLRKRTLRGLVRTMIGLHAPLMHGSEVVWAIWTALLFGQAITRDVAALLVKHEDPFVILLALYAQSVGRIAKSVQFDEVKSRVTVKALYTDDWILAYEVARQGWLGFGGKKNFLTTDVNFSSMFAAGVSFLDTSVSIPSRRMQLNPEEEDARGYG
jgi:hypothetical protein